jgi:hypothetical protein
MRVLQNASAHREHSTKIIIPGEAELENDGASTQLQEANETSGKVKMAQV